MLRGNNGQSIFSTDADRSKFSLLVQENTIRFNFSVHGFCWMSNHVHLVIRVTENSTSQIMQNIAFRYSSYFNYNKGQTGHLFQDRFKSILVEDSNYLLELIRYVHLNPVRAGIVAKPEDYIWSGHRTYLGMETISWLTQDHILKKFDSDEAISRACYKKYINQESLSDIRLGDIKNGNLDGGFLGSENFITNILEQHSHEHQDYTMSNLIDHVCNILNQPSSTIFVKSKDRKSSLARSIIAYFIKKAPHLTLQEFANYVERDISSLSKQAKDIELKLAIDSELVLVVDEVEKKLKNKLYD